MTGTPVGQARPRFRRTPIKLKKRKGISYSYPEPVSAAYKLALRWCALIAMAGRKPFTGPVIVNIIAYFPPSMHLSRQGRKDALAGKHDHLIRIDKDNIEKLVLDSLKGIVYVDDKQVVDGNTRKTYSEKPRIEIEVTPRED